MALQVAPLREEVTALKAAAAAEAEKNRVFHEISVFAAARSGDAVGVLALLQHTSLPVDCAVYGVTLLSTASQYGHLGLVEMLLGKGAEVDKGSTRGSTSLLSASFAGHLGVVGALLDKGAEVNTARTDGVSPFYAAAQNGHLGVVEALLGKGAEVDKACNDGRTPLYAAACNGLVGVVRALLGEGADVDKAHTRRGGVETPVQAATRNGHGAIVEILTRHAAGS